VLHIPLKLNAQEGGHGAPQQHPHARS
jgi:hypothetical protein